MGHAFVAGYKSADSVHLIFHQGDEGGHHNCGALHHQRRKLVAQGLSSSGRHKDKAILAFEQAADDLFLLSFEGVETEEILQCPVYGFTCCCHRLKN